MKKQETISPLARRVAKVRVIRVSAFMLVFYCLSVVSFVMPLRPTHSDMEHRDLAKFPSFSVGALMDGSYFDGINTWFADTFPLRDHWMALNAMIERCYGWSTVNVHGDVGSGDEIPDLPMTTTSTATTSTTTTTETTTTTTKKTTTTTKKGKTTTTKKGGKTTTTKKGDKTTTTKKGGKTTTTVTTTAGKTTTTLKGVVKTTTTKKATTKTTVTTTTVPTTTVTTTVTTVPPTTTTTASNAAVTPAGQDKVPTETVGAILVKGSSGFEYYHFSQSAADMYIASLNRLADLLDGKATVYDMIVPTSIDICLDQATRDSVNVSDQKKAITYMYGSMSDKVKKVEIFETLLNAHKSGEYLYFRTDHHWTAMGAYRAYEEFCKLAGRKPTALSAYEKVEFPDYLGSFYRDTQSAAMEANPDVVQAFIPSSTNTMTLHTSDGTTTYPIVLDVTDWSSLYKYNCFIAGDNPLSVIENPNKTDGSACLLIKESFGNAYAPFLTEDYQTVYVMDYRYFDEVDSRGIAQFVEENNIKDVLLLNNISATRNSYLMEALDALVR